jgi:formylglycine-generating enzyme required for sulfatase activity
VQGGNSINLQFASFNQQENNAMNYRLIVCLLMLSSATAFANNVRVTNITITGQNTGAKTTNVQFDLAWDNSWRDAGAPSATANWDACWLFIKFSTAPNLWSHASLSATAADHNGGSGTTMTVQPSADGRGVFIYRAATGSGNLAQTSVQLRWNYGADFVADDAPVTVRVFAIEMVYVPEGAFFAGDGSTAGGISHFSQGSTTAPFQITSEGALTLGLTPTTNLGNRNDASNVDDFNNVTTQTLPAAFPKGFTAFYCMKYEGTLGQWADFLNTLTSMQAANNSTQISAGSRGANNVLTGTYPNFTTVRPARVMQINQTPSYILNFSDWAALRPMTELEFEKAARGTAAAVADEYPWGTTSIQQATGVSGNEDGTETALPASANCNFGNVTFTGGDGGVGNLRAGIFAKSGTSREQSGASFWGIMDLGGSAQELCYNVGAAAARAFAGAHGNGTLNATGGSDVAGFPSSGFIYRGGSRAEASTLVRTSDRRSLNSFYLGLRVVRTAP